MSHLALHDDDTTAQQGSSSSSSFSHAVADPNVNDFPLRRSSRAPVRASVYFPDYSIDSPTIGRTIHVSNTTLSSFGSLPSPGPRSPRPPIPSPLSGTGFASDSPTSPSPRTTTFPSQNIPFTRPDLSQTAKGKSTSFYSDSSDSETPEPQTPRLDHSSFPNDTRSVSDPVTCKPASGLFQSTRPAMAGPVAAAQAEHKALPRNSSIDSAISAISAKSTSQNGSKDGQGTPDIANLVKTAGSPEAVIQYLLKEKHSQSQQNSQLWRLVDKQRAMILGLNKDLERALKDKEKYRKKLKEIMALPAISKAASVHQDGGRETSIPAGTTIPRVDVDRPKEPAAIAPDSPVLDSDSHGHSPVDMTLAPYPITPPADQPNGPSSVVGELLDPAHAMPRPQEHAYDKFDHEAEDKAVDQARKDRDDEQLKEIPFNLALPPSRSLPSEPPKVPPPKPPTGRPPTVAVVEATPQPDEGLSQFPAPPPRKPPPAPLQLKQDRRPTPVNPPEEEETDSDYDDILEVDEIVDEKRGRRKTREEDDRERAIIAIKEAAARSASKKSKSSRPASPREMPTGVAAVPPPLQPDAGAASLAAVLSGPESREISAPLRSPGLPVSPRPFAVNAPPLSPRMAGSFPVAPLSPRPPRGPIPLPPGTPLVTAPPPDGPRSSQGPNASQPAEIGHLENPANQESPTERTRIYKGLVTEEYPDLLLSPNALPSIMIKVASSRMKPSRASLLSLTQLEEDPVFTLAILSRADAGELWRVEKDSASLLKLDQRMKQCFAFTAKTPDRSLFSGHAPAKLDARRVALEQYMDELLNTPLDTNAASEFCKYLSTNTLPPNADETGSSGDAVSETSGTRIGPDGRPLRSGYLTKRGKNFGGWKARFFVLDGPHLKYFEAPGGAHLGTIKLQNAQIGKQSQNSENQPSAQGASGEDLDNQYRHAFLILEPKKKDSNSHVKHVLCAENDAERDRWVDALLQWIDYRDPSEAESPQTAKPHAGRQNAGAERSSGAKSRKGGNKSNHQPSDSDTLIGVRYDATQVGDAPQGVPSGRPKTSSGLPEGSQGSGFEAMSQKLISGPKDGQIISDTAAWGNKALSIPTNEEKKQRKRSFFGFGPKARSSSDGQDSLFGSSEGGSGATPPQNSYHGPVRQAFGAPLADAVRYSAPTDVNVPLPAVVYRCIQYLDAKNAILEEGIFRLSGSNIVIKGLRERFNTEGDVNLVTDEQYYDIHAVASLLKLYLRELPTTILTRDLHLEFLATTEMTDRSEKIAALNVLVQRLPQANGTLLKYLIAFLIKIINNADMNKMTVRNVGIVFSPTLNIPAPVFAMFLQNYEAIFGINPDEYELPSPISEAESQARFADAPPRFEPPQRPSTSNGSASPQRQPRKDSRDQLRSTPTPPLMMHHATGRGSPASLGASSRQGYESAYAGQQNPNMRPAYEGGYVVPPGYDSHNLHPSGRPNHGYDRGLYPPQEEHGNGAPGFDQSYNASNRRRESAIFMGGMVGLQHQGSRSRLREETRF